MVFIIKTVTVTHFIYLKC